MAAIADNQWPSMAFNFSVTCDHFDAAFQEVSGLKEEIQVAEYRHGESLNLATAKVPGLRTTSEITLKKGVFNSDSQFADWVAMMQTGDDETGMRSDIIITLMDEEQTAIQSWTIVNAFPKSFEGPTLNAQSNEVAVETLVLVHEGITTEFV